MKKRYDEPSTVLSIRVPLSRKEEVKNTVNNWLDGNVDSIQFNGLKFKQGFQEPYDFFMWVKNNNKQLLKDPKLYLDKLRSLDLKLLDKLKEKI